MEASAIHRAKTKCVLLRAGPSERSLCALGVHEDPTLHGHEKGISISVTPRIRIQK